MSRSPQPSAPEHESQMREIARQIRWANRGDKFVTYVMLPIAVLALIGLAAFVAIVVFGG